MRDLMRQHLGEDWEIWLVLANAIAGPDASREQVLSSQHRAVALVREISPDWTDADVGELVADARVRLWFA